MPKASFVLPVKNGEKFIASTIRSLQDQTVDDIEIVVVNDHSEDGTFAILEELAKSDGRIKPLNQMADKFGVGAARNFGTRQSSGDIILPTDSDDPNFKNRVEVSLGELANNNADIFYGNLERFYVESGERILRHFQDFDPILFQYINIVPNAGCSAFKREVFAAVGGYDESLAIGEDYDFYLTALEKGFKFASKNIALAQYTMHAGQATASPDPEKIKKRQEWNRRIREKHRINYIDLDYVKTHANPEVRQFYVEKNFEIWFGEESKATIK